MNRLMLSLQSMLGRTAAVLLLVLAAGSANASLLTGSMTVGAATALLQQQVDSLQTRAEDTGDYLIKRAYVSARNALDAVSAELDRQRDKTVESVSGLLDRLQGIEAIVDSTRDSALLTIDRARSLEVRIAQLLASTPLAASGPYITQISPQIVTSSISTGVYRIRVSGVDIKEIQIEGPEGAEVASVKQLDQTTYLLEIPVAWLQPEDNRMTTESFEVTLTGPREYFFGLLGPKRVLKQEVTLGVLPAVLATVRYQGVATSQLREERRVTRGEHFRGENRTIRKLIEPRKPEWRIDVEKPITVRGSGGRSARCQGHSDNDLSPNGILVVARVDEIGRSTRYPNGAPGRITCNATFTEFRLVDSKVPVQKELLIKWGKDEELSLPSLIPTGSYEILFFDGRVSKGTTTLDTPFLRVRQEGDKLFFRPQLPQNF